MWPLGNTFVDPFSVHTTTESELCRRKQILALSATMWQMEMVYSSVCSASQHFMKTVPSLKVAVTWRRQSHLVRAGYADFAAETTLARLGPE